MNYKLFLIAAIVLISNNINAQESFSIDTFPVISDKSQIYTASTKTRWFLLDVGTSLYLSEGSLLLKNQGTLGVGASTFQLRPLKSRNWNLHAYRQRIRIGWKHLYLLHGLSLEFYNYHFKHPVQFTPNEPHLSFQLDSLSYQKNVLKTTFLTVPVLVSFEAHPRRFRRSFRVSLGAYGSILMGARVDVKTEENGKKRIRDDYNLTKFRYGLRAEVGFGPINLYTSYSLTPLFRVGESPELYPLSAGVKVIPF